jgi:peptidyl-prolyl cis-trans isomerase SurA
MEPQTPLNENTEATSTPSETSAVSTHEGGAATSRPTPFAFLSTIPRHYLAFLAGLILAIVLGYFFYIRMNADVAAVVDGTKITRAELENNIAMMTKSAELQGMDVSDATVTEAIKTQALDNLINNALLMNAANEAGLASNEAAVQSAYETLLSEVGGEEELKSRMASVGLTDETLKGNISDRIIADAYIESVTDIENATVTIEEIESYLASISTQGITLPPLEEIKPQIESTLLAEKQQKYVDDLIAKLRSEATIEINK